MGLFVPQLYSNGPVASNDGAVVLGTAYQSGVLESFVWTAANGAQDVRTLLAAAGLAEASTWQSASLYAVSPNGKCIVGAGGGVSPLQQKLFTLRLR